MLGRIPRHRARVEEVAVEAADGGEMSGDAAAPEAAPSQPGEVPRQLADRGRRESGAVVFEECPKALEVTAIGQERIGGGPPLHLEGPEKLADRIHQGFEAGAMQVETAPDTPTPRR
jgi:hypothetical protein